MSTLGLVEPLSQSLPLWAIALVLIVVSVCAVELGAFIARRHLSSLGSGTKRVSHLSDAQGYVVGAIFGLLAFLIGLTFSIALDRYDTRRGWVAEEATAISTAYLRTDMLDEPSRSKLRQTIRDYTRNRILPDGLSRDEFQHRQAESERLQTKLWQETREAVFPVRGTELASYIVEGMNNMLDVGTRRWLASMEHIPSQILDIQLIYLIAAGAALGYILGMERRRARYASNLLIALFVLAFVMILDIDRPRTGTIKVPQRGLEQLIAQMDADAARDSAVNSASSGKTN